MGPVVLDEMGAATSERVLACKNYLAFYRIEKADVYIDRVLQKIYHRMTEIYNKEATP